MYEIYEYKTNCNDNTALILIGTKCFIIKENSRYKLGYEYNTKRFADMKAYWTKLELHEHEPFLEEIKKYTAWGLTEASVKIIVRFIIRRE